MLLTLGTNTAAPRDVPHLITADRRITEPGRNTYAQPL